MAQALNMVDIDRALAGFTIPPRPELLVQLQQEIDKPEPDIHHIASLINQDMGVAGFTLKVVNSAIFSLSKKVSSIEQACIILGLGKLQKLVNSIVLRFSLSCDPQAPFLDLLWSSSNDIANATTALANYLDIELVEDAYTLGMFHNAGMALIYQQNTEYPTILAQAYQQSSNIGEFEETMFESSHEVLGFLIAQSWGLSNELSNVIAYHHAGSIMLSTGSFAEKELFCVLKLAEHMLGLAKKLGQAEIDHEWEKHHQTILDILELEIYQLDDLGDMLFGFEVNSIYHNK